MKHILLTLFFCAIFFLHASKIFGQDYIPMFSTDYVSRLSLEIDPITFLYKGHSLHIRYQPMFSERFLIGVGTYALDLPDPIVDLNKSNRDEGWEVRIRGAFSIYGELYANEANKGFFIGEQAGFQSFRISNDRETGGSSSFNSLLLLTYLGYSWYPYKGSFYLKPWVGLGYTEKIDGLNKVGTMRYDIGPWFPFITVHAGYTF